MGIAKQITELDEQIEKLRNTSEKESELLHQSLDCTITDHTAAVYVIELYGQLTLSLAKMAKLYKQKVELLEEKFKRCDRN